ncbi:MAG: pyruvate dehydrogenase (acetyl-transferring) E1 component subunit alpha [Alphaproteobacteria bacterium]|nr:pyruvate dehydrogenase (acetyl-transferring) E1 component subunit alpha [Alphaproteobacteria bacterium]MDD9920104.1 pyruvate dehydrogenase (acetyl-transferring) E1 component subunit alpha [Alphaproteobacteria bacterium]
MAQTPSLSKSELIDIYKEMLLLRRFEERAANLYQQGQIRGFCHLYIGQEAVLIGCKAASQKGDDFITSYRCHAQALACGVSPEAVMSELTGRSTGISRGKGGSMHMFDPEKGFWGGHGIVGAQVPLGTGLAFAAKYRGEDKVCFTFIGDGAMNQGQVFESLNMAALWDLPVLYVIENNQYGMGTAASRIAAGDLYKRGEPFSIKGQKVDGQDFFAVHAAVSNAVADIRAGKGPQIIEMDTYRYRGHSMSDPAKYRTREEVDCVKNERDPINKVAEYLIKEFKVQQEELDVLDKEIKELVKECAEFATSAPEPALSEISTDIMPV